jgi:carbon monoxide dehydrogenase subunit G
MAIEIRETFQVQAPIEAVWRFVMDAQQVVTCMPGASLDQVVDERTFLGSVKVKVGAITTSYKGRVQFTEIDEQNHTMQMVAEGRETGGGLAKGTMGSHLRSLPDGKTEVVAEASVDITGRIMQVGRGMIQGVSHQLFLQFVAAVKERLEVAQSAAPQGAVTQAAAAEPKPIRILPILFQAFWAAVVGFFRRLFGRSAT